jgi:hypothetical protein
MAAYILIEEGLDASALGRALPAEFSEEVVIVLAGNISNVHSLARSLLVKRRTPVALVIKGAKCSPEITQERRQSTEEVVGYVAAGVPMRVLTVVNDVISSDSPVMRELTEFLEQTREPSLARKGAAATT